MTATKTAKSNKPAKAPKEKKLLDRYEASVIIDGKTYKADGWYRTEDKARKAAALVVAKFLTITVTPIKVRRKTTEERVG